MNLEKIIVNGILVLIFTIPATLAYGFHVSVWFNRLGSWFNSCNITERIYFR